MLLAPIDRDKQHAKTCGFLVSIYMSAYHSEPRVVPAAESGPWAYALSTNG